MGTPSLVLPTSTLGAPGRQFCPAWLAFAAVASRAVYVMFIISQHMRYLEIFLPADGVVSDANAPARLFDASPRRPGKLVTVGRGAHRRCRFDEGLITDDRSRSAGRGLPQSFDGVVIAVVVLAPETVTAVRAARLDQVQTGMNLRWIRRWSPSA